MNAIVRATAAEFLKLRRTLIVKLAVGTAVAVVLLNAIIATQQQPAPGRSVLMGFAQGTLMMWTLLALPIFTALVAAFVAAIDHQGDNWKHIFTLPVPRYAIFAAKYAVGAALLLAGALVLVGGIWTGSAVLRIMRPTITAEVLPTRLVFVRVFQSWLAAGLALSIQLWVSLRWRNFVAGLAVVMVALVVLFGGAGRAQTRAAFAKYYPWAMPVTAIARMAEGIPDRAFATAGGAISGLAAAFAGCWTLARRDF
jgi:hypothetical protein